MAVRFNLRTPLLNTPTLVMASSSKFVARSLLIFTLFIYLHTFAFSYLFSFHVQAQENGQLTQEQMTTDQVPEIIDTAALRAEFRQYTQDPKSKVVRFEMILQSQISSDRVLVQWSVTGKAKVVEGFSTRINVVVEPGKTYTIPLEVQTLGFGISEVYGKAEAFQAEGSSIATVRKTFVVNENGEILPITVDYQNKKNLSLAGDVLKWVGLAIAFIVFAFIGFRLFVKWFNKDVVREYDEKFKPKQS